MSNKITIKVTKMAYYKNSLVYPNEIIKNYVGEVPSWATLANGKEVNPKLEEIENENPDNVGQGEAGKSEDAAKGEGSEQMTLNNIGQGESENEEQSEVVVAGDGGVHVIPAEKTEVEIMEEYNKLLDEAVEKNILLDDADKKTIVEQIAELKKLLGKE